MNNTKYYIIIFSLFISYIYSQNSESGSTNIDDNTICTIFENCEHCTFCGNTTKDYTYCSYGNIFCHHIRDKNQEYYEYNTPLKNNYSQYFRENTVLDSFCGAKSISLNSMKNSFQILETNIHSNQALKSIHCDYEISNKYYYEHLDDSAKVHLEIKNACPDKNKQIKFNLYMIYEMGKTLKFANLTDNDIRYNDMNRSLNQISEMEILIDFTNDINNDISIEEVLLISILTDNPSKKTRLIYIIVIIICAILFLLIIVLIILYIFLKRKMEYEYRQSIDNERIEKEKKIENNKKILNKLLENELKAKIYTKDLAINDCESCSICIENFECGKSEISITPCKHIFHFSCIQKWILDNVLNPKCPNCNFNLLESQTEEVLNINKKDSNGNNNNVNNNNNRGYGGVDLHRSENIIISRINNDNLQPSDNNNDQIIENGGNNNNLNNN